MKKFICIPLLVMGLAAASQDETVKKLQKDAGLEIKKEADTIPRKWRKGGLYNINLAQGSLKNWAAGGDDFSLSVNSILNLFAFYKEGKHSWDNTFDFNLGYVRTTSLGGRKNDDRIDLLSKYGRAVSSQWNVASLFNFRSQLLKGYNYTEDTVVLSSNFLSPALMLFSLGMDYKPNDHFSVFMSPFTGRWIIVRDDSLSAKGAYGVPPGKKVKTEFGAFVTANYLRALTKTLTYKGRLDLFSNYRHKPQNIDLFMTNVFSARLTRALSASWNIDFIYDDDVQLFGKNGRSPALQIKSLTGLGLQVRF